MINRGVAAIFGRGDELLQRRYSSTMVNVQFRGETCHLIIYECDAVDAGRQINVVCSVLHHRLVSLFEFYVFHSDLR